MTCVDPFSHLRLDLHHCFVLKRALKIGAEESPTTATPALCKSYKKKKSDVGVGHCHALSLLPRGTLRVCVANVL